MGVEDRHGLTATAATAGAVRAFDDAVTSYVGYRTDAMAHLSIALEADAGFVMAHVLKGYLTMLSFKLANVPAARSAHKAAAAGEAGTTTRERMHVRALGQWIEGDIDGMLSTWGSILHSNPKDILAFRLHHFNAFWVGRPEEMLTAVENVLPAWTDDLPAFGSVLACRSFAHEECGNYTIAEHAGRRAIELDPSDVWAAHAIAHVLEMQGRRSEGIQWLEHLQPQWQGRNNLTHHLWWHRGLYHLEHREFGKVLDLYDSRFRNLRSPLTEAQPDLYIDLQNAASMLFRLERQGIGVGERWTEIADKAEARIGDCLSAFTLPHLVMSLAATGRDNACRAMIEAMTDYGGGATYNARVVRDYAVPVAKAFVLHAQRSYVSALEVMRPAIGGMYVMGGSHAQQDVFEQLFLDCALRAGSSSDTALLIERVRGRHPVPPEHRIGYAEGARRLS